MTISDFIRLRKLGYIGFVYQLAYLRMSDITAFWQ